MTTLIQRPTFEKRLADSGGIDTHFVLEGSAVIGYQCSKNVVDGKAGFMRERRVEVDR